MMIVIYPDVSNLTEDDQYVSIYRDASQAIAEQLAVPTYSGFDAFLGNPLAKRDMTFSVVDPHPNCEAHEIFGRWVFQKWLNNYGDRAEAPR